jgi:hypothetical protein
MIVLPGRPIRQVDRGKQRWLEAKQPHVPERGRETISGQQGLSVGELNLHEPADVDVDVRQSLREAREPDGALPRLGPNFIDLLLEPLLELIGGDWHARVATDRQLHHEPIVDGSGGGGNGCHSASKLHAIPSVGDLEERSRICVAALCGSRGDPKYARWR